LSHFGTEYRSLPGTKTKIIVVETQIASLKEMEAKLSPYHVVVGTSQLDRALPLLRSERDAAAIVVSTAKGADVLAVLESARQERPAVLRILLTEFEDLTTIVEGLHSGAVQRVVSRPLQFVELLGVIRSADTGTAPRTLNA
jgi:two-component system probable response regulator PhcQ